MSVINPHNDPEIIYEHFANKLKIKNFDFIIPYVSHEAKLDYVPQKIGEYITSLFKLWINQDDPTINMRLIHTSICF